MLLCLTVEYKDFFFLPFSASELDETEVAFLEIWGFGLLCAELLALFCDINWVQREIRQSHIKPNYSATQVCHYLPLKHM